MAKSDKVKQLNKIEVNSSEVIINDLVIDLTRRSDSKHIKKLYRKRLYKKSF